MDKLYYAKKFLAWLEQLNEKLYKSKDPLEQVLAELTEERYNVQRVRTEIHIFPAGAHKLFLSIDIIKFVRLATKYNVWLLFEFDGYQNIRAIFHSGAPGNIWKDVLKT